jgi:hypothetical protein
VVSGRWSLEKELEVAHLIRLYTEIGSRDRFSCAHVEERTAHALAGERFVPPNDTRPQGAVHPTNPRILKTIPRACAALARHAGFEVIEADDVDTFDAKEFVQSQISRAMKELRKREIVPTMNAAELLSIMREK